MSEDRKEDTESVPLGNGGWTSSPSTPQINRHSKAESWEYMPNVEASEETTDNVLFKAAVEAYHAHRLKNKDEVLAEFTDTSFIIGFCEGAKWELDKMLKKLEGKD